MGNDLITYQEKTQRLNDWARELKINRNTLKDRLQRGWTVDEALSKPVQDNKLMRSVGAQIKDNVRTSFDRIWKRVGKKEFERQLALAFEEDALKVVKEFAQYLPKDAVERTDKQDDKAVVRIEFNHPPTTPNIQVLDIKGAND